MDGSTHRLFAASVSLAVSTAAGAPPWQTAGAAVISTATSAGWTSPDADQSWLRWMPGGHRGLSHWWGLPVLAAAATVSLVPADLAWVAWALVLGWSSHLVGDFVFGVRPPGIPLLPWWGHVGLRFDSGGGLERVLRWAWPALLLWQVWVYRGGTPWPFPTA